MRWSFKAAQPIAEHEADDALDDIYHDIRQTLRVTGVNLIFRVWASHNNALPTIWKALSPTVGTQAFEEAADTLRSKAVELAVSVGRLEVPASVTLGPSQAYQITKALSLYHYINPKLLLITALVREAMQGDASVSTIKSSQRTSGRIPRGEPPGMYPMEMVAAKPDDRAIADLFAQITRHYSLSTINSDYRTLALWPDYLAAAWPRLKSLSLSATYRHADRALQSLARELASALSVSVSTSELNQKIQSVHKAARKTAVFNQRLPPLLLNIALLALDWRSQHQLAQSPYPLGGT